MSAELIQLVNRRAGIPQTWILRSLFVYTKLWPEVCFFAPQSALAVSMPRLWGWEEVDPKPKACGPSRAEEQEGTTPATGPNSLWPGWEAPGARHPLFLPGGGRWHQADICTQASCCQGLELGWNENDLFILRSYSGIMPWAFILPSPTLVSFQKHKIKSGQSNTHLCHASSSQQTVGRQQMAFPESSADRDGKCTPARYSTSSQHWPNSLRRRIISVLCCVTSSLYYDEDGDLAHEFYEETVVTKNGRKKSKLKRIQKNLIPQVREGFVCVCVCMWFVWHLLKVCVSFCRGL